MLAPFILALLSASGLLLVVGWASEAVSASMRDAEPYARSSLNKRWRATIPLPTSLGYGDSGATWTSRLAPAVTISARLALCTAVAVRPVPRAPEQRQCRDSCSRTRCDGCRDDQAPDQRW
jgi:hypothetical protein